MATVREVMNSRIAGIRVDATLAEAVESLMQAHMEGSPVVDTDGAVVGIISESDLIDMLFDPATRNEPVAKYMDPDVHAIHPDDSLTCAAQLFALYSFGRLPVVEDGKLVGLITRRDLLNFAMQTGDLLTDPLTEMNSALAPLS